MRSSLAGNLSHTVLMMTAHSLSGATGIERMDTVLNNRGNRSAARWSGAGATELELTGPATDEQIRSLIVDALHPDSERLLPQLIAQGYAPHAAEMSLRLGRRNSSAATRAAPPLLGYDLTFSPPTEHLAARAPHQGTEAAQRRAHELAMASTLAWIEPISAVTRTTSTTRAAGRFATAAGTIDSTVTQVTSAGFIAATIDTDPITPADPEMSTHILISSRVHTTHGRWLAIDGRVLHSVSAAASALYDAAFRQYLLADTPANTQDGILATTADALDAGRESIDNDLSTRRTWSASRGYTRLFRSLSRAQLTTPEDLIPLADNTITSIVNVCMTDGWELFSTDRTLLATRRYLDDNTISGALTLRRLPHEHHRR
ncbi:relaxase domain-containing protein [Rhodococcus qingshengii]|uniref:relaxase domain-containing protein n=1 Tax=Rhodococcus qingshengii TaxID=334542 RepID=UPI001455E943|nr:relaxase domain-containing protein [Rhodococcus qingshengii]